MRYYKTFSMDKKKKLFTIIREMDNSSIAFFKLPKLNTSTGIVTVWIKDDKGMDESLDSFLSIALREPSMTDSIERIFKGTK